MVQTKAKTEPQLTYTAIDLAKELGTSDTNIRTKWYPYLKEIWWWLACELKNEEDRFTAVAREKFIELQSAISPKIPVRSADNIILRNDEGKPLMRDNSDRIGINAYKQQVWEKFNRFPLQRIDAPTPEALAQLPVVEAEVCDETSIVLHEQGLTTIEDIGSNLDKLFADIDQAAVENGSALVGRYAQKLTKTVEAGVSSVHANLGNAMNSRSRKAS